MFIQTFGSTIPVIVALSIAFPLDQFERVCVACRNAGGTPLIESRGRPNRFSMLHSGDHEPRVRASGKVH